MSNETDLDWLARNVHVWPEGRREVLVCWPRNVDTIIWSSVLSDAGWITKAQWLARRAELQNKPSWSKAEEWAEWLAQDSYGCWGFFQKKPLMHALSWIARSGYYQIHSPGNLLLGDWRDTLERRPESVPESPVDIAMGIIGYIDWSTAPAGATHHIGGDQLECPWHQNFSHIRYWNGERWVKRSAFRTLDEAVAKGFAVVARPADLSDVASSAASVAAATDRLTEATQNVLAAVPALMDEKYSFEPEFNPVTVTNETVQLEKPAAVTGTGNGSASESAFLIGRVIDLLRTSVDHFSANELADLHQLCDAELTKRDAAVCGGQKYIDAHWFERGELPPVGVSVQWRPGSAGQWEHDSWIDVDVIAHAGDGDIVIKWDGQAGNNKQLVTASQETFRTIRTEREELESLLRSTALSSFDDLDIIAGAIIAAGFRKEQK